MASVSLGGRIWTLSTFIINLKSARWDTVLDCIDVTDAWKAFKDIFLDAAEEHAPLRRKISRENNPIAPWLTDRVKNMIGRRDAARRKAIKTKAVQDWEIYRSLRNQTTTMIRKAKKSHFADAVTEAKGNQSLMWRVINTFTGKSKPNSHVCNLERPDDTTTSNPSDMAQEFNDYFSACASRLTDGLPASRDPLRNIPEPTKTFSFESVDETTVLNELQRLKTRKATGMDKIPSRLLKDAAPVIVKPLTHIFNLSLSTGEVPAEWKEAQISPIHKSGTKTNVANYRPVSVLNITSKVMEKLVANQVTLFLTRNGLLTPHQSGFRKLHSTATAVQKIVEDLKSAYNSSKVTVALFLDLRKAFDTCSTHLYADDTIIYYSADSVKECEEAVSRDMKRVADWLNDNKLILHPDKTKLLNRAARIITGYKLQDHVPVHTLLAEAGLESVRLTHVQQLNVYGTMTPTSFIVQQQEWQHIVVAYSTTAHSCGTTFPLN
ncbi:hypothetical protein Bbelb_246520 [Branchiostoma belcheri]|nr:hypothetical protein Bbelb_246520 [Branchiostoma belcheri]